MNHSELLTLKRERSGERHFENLLTHTYILGTLYIYILKDIKCFLFITQTQVQADIFIDKVWNMYNILQINIKPGWHSHHVCQTSVSLLNVLHLFSHIQWSSLNGPPYRLTKSGKVVRLNRSFIIVQNIIWNEKRGSHCGDGHFAEVVNLWGFTINSVLSIYAARISNFSQFDKFSTFLKSALFKTFLVFWVLSIIKIWLN